MCEFIVFNYCSLRKKIFEFINLGKSIIICCIQWKASWIGFTYVCLNNNLWMPYSSLIGTFWEEQIHAFFSSFICLDFQFIFFAFYLFIFLIEREREKEREINWKRERDKLFFFLFAVKYWRTYEDISFY